MERISEEPNNTPCLAVKIEDIRQEPLSPKWYVSGMNVRLNNLRNIPDANPLGHYVDINPGVNIRGMDPETCVDFIGMGNVESDITGEYTITSKYLDEVRGSGYTRFENGDILWAKLDQSMQNGKSCFVDNLKNRVGFGSTEFHVLRVKNNYLSPKFLFDFLNQESFRFMASHCFTGSSRLRVSPEYLATFPFVIPSVEQQNEVVAKMDKARAKRKAKLLEADKLLSNINDSIFDNLRIALPPEDSRRIFAVRKDSIKHRFDSHFYTPNLVQIEHMLSQTQNAPLGTLVSFSQETWNPRKEENEKIRYVEIGSVCRKTGLASWQEIPTWVAPSRARMKIRSDDIAISLTRPHHGSIAHLGEEFEGCIASTGFAVIRDVAPQISREYLWFILRAPFSLHQLFRHASGGNYPAITQQELEKIIIPVPNKEVQSSIIFEAQKQYKRAIMLREEAQTIWKNAKQWFEDQFGVIH